MDFDTVNAFFRNQVVMVLMQEHYNHIQRLQCVDNCKKRNGMQ